MHRLFLVLAVAGIFSSCGGSKVLSSELVPGTDFSKYHSFDFKKMANNTPDSIPPTYTGGMDLLKKSISDEMTKRGYVQSAENPDLLINIGVAVREKAQTRETDWRTDGRMTYIGQRNYSWKSQEIVVGYYKEGTVDLNLVDASNQQMIWKSTVSEVLPEKAKNLQSTVNRGVSRLFKDFPIKAK